MKRVFSATSMKAATASVVSKLEESKSGLSIADASALSDMMAIAGKHAQELSKDQLAFAQAGASLKPKSIVAL